MTLIWTALVALVAGCSSGASGTASSASHAPPPPGSWSVLALGDSVPAGTACHCTPYPQLTATALAGVAHRQIVAVNDAVAGYKTTDVLHQLADDRQVIADTRRADLVEIEIGANDVYYSSDCGTTVACYSSTVPQVESNLKAIVTRVHQLTAGHRTLVVLLDYWSAWLGGQYARAKGSAYAAAALLVTDEVNTVIRSVAAQTGSAYVDLRAVFKGPDYDRDETGYLASDGDHPNTEGHQKIAAAVVQVVEQRLGLPGW